MSEQTQLVDRFVVGVDVEKYSARNVRQQDETQHALNQILSTTASAAGLDRRQWVTAPGGDGELAILPGDVDMVAVVGRFVSELDDRLGTFNEDRVPAMKLRLRVAMHIDTVKLSAFGHAGPGLVVLSRLLDATVLRAALSRAPDANLVLLVSEPVYRKVVESGFGGLQPRRFGAITVDNKDKGFRQTAYLYIPGTSPAVGARLGDAAGAEHGHTAEASPRGQPPAPATGGPAAARQTTQIAGTITNAEIISPVIHRDLNIGGSAPGPGD
jgi:hypothetical protein